MSFNPTALGAVTGIGGMVKALMDGNDQYSQDQKMQQKLAAMKGMGQQPGAPVNIVLPMASQPPVNPQAMQGSMAAPAPMPMQRMSMTPFPQNGTPPVNIDPMTKALFSPIPGAVGGQ